MLRARTTQFFGYYPGTVALLTAAHAGERNVMSAGWHAACSADPPLYGVAVGPERATHRLILASGRFGVNFMTAEHARAVQGAGVLSLHDGVDKFARLALSAEGDPPALTRAYLHYACTVEQVVRTGDHDWIVGRVQAVQYDPEAFDEARLVVQDVSVYLGRGAYVRAGGTREVFPPDTYTVE